MLYTLKGIVLRVVEYSESSLVVTAYTDLFGLQSYIVKGARKKNSKTKPSYFQPLSLVEMVVFKSSGEKLNTIQEIKINKAFASIPFDIKKQAVAFFINELLVKTIKEEEPNSSLFSFLFSSIQLLDVFTGNCSNFHLVFTLQLSRFLGFYPQGVSNGQNYFDLVNGSFISNPPQHFHFLNPQYTLLLHQIIETSLSNCDTISISSETRVEFIDKLIEYYSLHIPAFKDLRSVEVLKAVFS